MKVLDRYIVRELVLPVFYCLMSLVFLTLIADLFNNLDELLKNQTPFFIILNYYLALIPRAFSQTIPWAGWLGTMFLLVNFGFHNETLAMKAAGIQITTIVRPILFFGFLIGIAAYLVNDRIVPHTYRIASETKEVHIQKKKEKEAQRVFQNVTYSSGRNQHYYFRTFSKSSQTVEDAVILWLNESAFNARRKMVARHGAWKDGAWEFEQVTEFNMDSRGRILGEPRTFPKKVYPEITFTPQDLAAASSESQFLTYRELKHLIGILKENGLRVHSENVDLHYRLASPWQCLVMMIITIPFLAKTTNRKLIALNVLFCVALIFSYHVVSSVGIAMGKAEKLFPFLAAWASNIIFGLGGLVYLEKADY